MESVSGDGKYLCHDNKYLSPKTNGSILDFYRVSYPILLAVIKGRILTDGLKSRDSLLGLGSAGPENRRCGSTYSSQHLVSLKY